MGAAAGCVVGHEMKMHQKREEAKQKAAAAQAAPTH
jgi:AhpD family alkylhydroperoxidase